MKKLRENQIPKPVTLQVSIHINNLINTYGEKKLEEILKMFNYYKKEKEK